MVASDGEEVETNIENKKKKKVTPFQPGPKVNPHPKGF